MWSAPKITSLGFTPFGNVRACVEAWCSDFLRGQDLRSRGHLQPHPALLWKFAIVKSLRRRPLDVLAAVFGSALFWTRRFLPVPALIPFIIRGTDSCDSRHSVLPSRHSWRRSQPPMLCRRCPPLPSTPPAPPIPPSSPAPLPAH